MLTMKINGGLASQLNKFIIGYQIAKFLDTKLCIDISDYYKGYFRPYILNYFNLPTVYIADDTNIDVIKSNSLHIKNCIDLENLLEDKNANDYYIGIEDAYYDDFLRKYNSFSANSNSQIIKDLDINFKSEFLYCFDKYTNGKNTVGIHIRRGDFVKLGREENIDFYKAAIGYFESIHKDNEYFFFSNDLEWVYNNFGNNKKFHYVFTGNGIIGDIEEFMCLAKCKYRVLSKLSGFGSLANKISIARFAGKYAVRSNELEVQNNEDTIVLNKVLNNDLEFNNNEYYYLTNENFKLGLEYYNNFINVSNKDIDVDRNEEIENINHIDEFLLKNNNFSLRFVEQVINKRINTYYTDNNIELLRSCLENNFCYSILNKKKYYVYWEKVYDLPKNFSFDNITFLSLFGNMFKWMCFGKYRMAIILSRIGYNINYIKIMSANETLAKDMDGRFVGLMYSKFNFKVLMNSRKIILNNSIVQIIKYYFEKILYKIVSEKKYYELFKNKHKTAINKLLDNLKCNDESISFISIINYLDKKSILKG